MVSGCMERMDDGEELNVFKVDRYAAEGKESKSAGDTVLSTMSENAGSAAHAHKIRIIIGLLIS